MSNGLESYKHRDWDNKIAKVEETNTDKYFSSFNIFNILFRIK